MAGLLAFMVLVSCSDGFKDCNLADKISPYPTMAACEAQLDRNLNKASQKHEYVLARCVAGQGRIPANDNTAAGDENADKPANSAMQAANDNIFGEIAWQVSTHGDLLAEMKPAANNAAAGGGEADKKQDLPDNSALYAENIGSSGAQTIDNSPALLAMASSAENPEAAGGAAQAAGGHRGSMLALYGKYKGKKAKNSKNSKSRPAPQETLNEASAKLAGYSPKYIYETNSFDIGGYYNNANIDIIWGSQLLLSEAAFEIEYPAERIYALSPAIAAVLRNPDAAEPMLPTQDYFLKSGASFQKLFRQDMFDGEENVTPASDNNQQSRGKNELIHRIADASRFMS